MLTILNQQDDPQTAFHDITTGGRKVAAASDILSQMGMIAIDDSQTSVTVTEYGRQSLADEGLVDEMGTITDDGNKILSTKNNGEQPKEADPNAFESFSPLLRDLLNLNSR